MPRTALEPGQTTIDTAKPVKLPNGAYQIQWRIRYFDGKIEKRTTKHKGTVGQLRRKAKKKAEELFASHGTNCVWKKSSLLTDYIHGEVVPAVENNDGLRARTKEQYLRLLDWFCEEMKGYSITSASRPHTLEKALSTIALAHGTATAQQVRKVVSRHVMQRLVVDELLSHNPLREFEPQLPEHKAVNKPEGGQALTPEERGRVVDYLLNLDPEEVPPPKRGVYTHEDVIAKRRLEIDVTLTQATTGVRIGETLHLREGNVYETEGGLVLDITPELSKTKRGRRIPVLDERVAERLRERLVGKKPEDLVFPAPARPDKVWDSNNAQKALKRLYAEIAEALDIPLLKEVRTHVWRATLNTEWMGKGVPDIVRAAYFGHTPEVNKLYYTDLTDITYLMNMLAG